MNPYGNTDITIAAERAAKRAKTAVKKNPPKNTKRPWGALVAKPRTQGTLDTWLKNEPRSDTATDGGTGAPVHD